MTNEENKDLSIGNNEEKLENKDVNISISSNGALVLITVVSIFLSIIPPIIGWIGMRNSFNIDQQKYLANLLNFQITMFLIGVITGAILPFLLGVVAFVNLIILVIATLKIANSENYKFPLTFDFIKVEEK